MAKINLLPWREELRKQQKQDFFMAIGAGLLLTCVLFGLFYLHVEGLKEHQQQRNRLLQDEIRRVDKKIKEIRDIEGKKSKLLTKIDVIYQLQKSRPQIVHLFDELAKTTPEGIFLTKFVQKGNALTFTGKAQSNARVSAYMRAIEASPWLKDPVLQVIHGKPKKDSQLLSDFVLNAKQGGDNQAKGQEGKK